MAEGCKEEAEPNRKPFLDTWTKRLAALTAFVGGNHRTGYCDSEILECCGPKPGLNFNADPEAARGYHAAG